MTDKLINRMLVNVLGIPALLWIIWMGGTVFNIFIAVVVLIALWEYYHLVKTHEFGNPLMIPGMVVSLGILCFYTFYQSISGLELVAGFSIVFLALVLMELFRNIPNPTRNLSVTFLGLLYIPTLLGTFIWIRNWDVSHTTHFTFAVFISVWVCDSFAYLFGKQWGKKKILPRVSPNKSWVGTLSGVVGAFLTLWVMRTLQFLGGDIGWKDIIILTFITGVFGQLGDFSESLIKRDAGVKDSGKLLKGHGGVFDRFDSLLFAGPLTFAYLVLTKLG